VVFESNSPEFNPRHLGVPVLKVASLYSPVKTQVCTFFYIHFNFFLLANGYVVASHKVLGTNMNYQLGRETFDRLSTQSQTICRRVQGEIIVNFQQSRNSQILLFLGDGRSWLIKVVQEEENLGILLLELPSDVDYSPLTIMSNPRIKSTRS